MLPLLAHEVRPCLVYGEAVLEVARNQHIVLEHWDDNKSASTSKLDSCYSLWVTPSRSNKSVVGRGGLRKRMTHGFALSQLNKKPPGKFPPGPNG
jgi:hypothetical protein